MAATQGTDQVIPPAAVNLDQAEGALRAKVQVLQHEYEIVRRHVLIEPVGLGLMGAIGHVRLLSHYYRRDATRQRRLGGDGLGSLTGE